MPVGDPGDTELQERIRGKSGTYSLERTILIISCQVMHLGTKKALTL